MHNLFEKVNNRTDNQSPEYGAKQNAKKYAAPDNERVLLLPLFFIPHKKETSSRCLLSIMGRLRGGYTDIRVINVLIVKLPPIC